MAQSAEANNKAVVKYWANLSEKLWLFLLGIIRDKIPENKKPIRGRKIVSLANMKIDKKLKKFLVKKNLFSLFYNRIYFWQIFKLNYFQNIFLQNYNSCRYHPSL